MKKAPMVTGLMARAFCCAKFSRKLYGANFAFRARQFNLISSLLKFHRDVRQQLARYKGTMPLGMA